MKSRERVEHIIAVQTAWKEGKQIEQSLKGKDDWRDKYTPFDWAVYDYRVKEEDESKELTIEERAEAIYKGNTIEEDAYKRGATEQREIDLHRAKNTIQAWLEDEGFCYDESIFINLQKSIMGD